MSKRIPKETVKLREVAARQYRRQNGGGGNIGSRVASAKVQNSEAMAPKENSEKHRDGENMGNNMDTLGLPEMS